jgi:hypothetical protein
MYSFDVELIVDGADSIAVSLVERYFSENLQIAAAFRKANARVAIFGARHARGSAAVFFASMQSALDVLEALTWWEKA